MRIILIIFTFIGTVTSLFGALPARTDSLILGQIGFHELRVSDIIIGMEPYERELLQDIVVDMNVSLDFHSKIDPISLATITEKEAREGKYLFIDVLGIETLKQVFVTYPHIEEAFIRIQKPAALPLAKSGGLVEISLRRLAQSIDPLGI